MDQSPIPASTAQARVGKLLADLLQMPSPVLATEPGTSVKPLAIGLGRVLVWIAVDGKRTAVRKLTRDYVSRTSYLKALAADGAVRWRLDGTPGDTVSAEHQEDARKRLEARYKQDDARRARRPSGRRRRPPSAVSPEDGGAP